MSLTVTELAEEVRESNRRLTAAIDALRSEAEDLRVEVTKINTSLNRMRGIARVVAGSAVAILILVGTGVYRFGHVEGEITRLGGDIKQLRTDMDQVRKDTAEWRAEIKGDLAKLRGDTDQVRKDTAEWRAEARARDDRLSRTLERIEKALPPAPKG